MSDTLFAWVIIHSPFEVKFATKIATWCWSLDLRGKHILNCEISFKVQPEGFFTITISSTKQMTIMHLAKLCKPFPINSAQSPNKTILFGLQK
jgi:hypothetical protein